VRRRSRLTVLAAVAAVVTSFAVAPPASADAFDPKCVGDKVIRCVRLDTDGTGLSAAASITDDQTDGSNYDVSVTRVDLMAYDSNLGWRAIDVATSPGWDREWDRAETAHWACSHGSSFKVHAILHWRAAGSTGNGEAQHLESESYDC
jgi:hypothetical protein